MIMLEDLGIIGESPAIQSLRTIIARIAPLDIPVLIQGPTGAGKELVAHAIHAMSGRVGRFVAVNVCAIPEAMFEATLFGHVRGAFTGATADSRGYFEEADGGSIFLDEIGSLALPLQAKLLRVIETGDYRPIGARADRHSSFRMIAATNEPLDVLVASGRCRRDLAHRLSGFIIDVPPLNRRAEDIPLLAEYFLRALTDGRKLKFTASALRTLQEYDWPGNVRELRRVIERMVAVADGSLLRRHDVLMALRLGGREDNAWGADSLDRRRLIKILDQCGWDTARAAARLGVHRATVYRRMQRLGISSGAANRAVASENDDELLPRRKKAL